MSWTTVSDPDRAGKLIEAAPVDDGPVLDEELEGLAQAGGAQQSRAIRFVCPYRAPSMGPPASPVMDASYPLRAQNEPMQTAAVILAAGLLTNETLQY